MLVAGQLLLESPTPGESRVAPGFVRVADGVLAEVVEGEVPESADLGGPDCLIAPGLVDTHLHLPQFDTIGAHGLPLLEWLQQVTFPAEARWADADYAAAMTRRVARQLLSCGTTAICAYSSVHHAATAAAIETVTAAGLRGVVGQALSSRFAPDELIATPPQLLDETADLLDRFPATDRVAAAITPRFAVSCGEEVLQGAGRLAAEHPEALVQTHLSETPAECELVRDLFGDRSYVTVYDEAGLVLDRTLFGHGIYVDADEQQRLAKAAAVIAHCPTANSFLRSGPMDRSARLASGVRLALGSDIGGGYERSMVRVSRAMIETASALGLEYPSAAEAWWQITAGNADAARMGASGRLRVGAPADLLVARPDLPWVDSSVDPLAMLLFAWDDRWIERVLIDGRTVHPSVD